ncbi:MAG: ribosome recycling factor, partial [Natronospirillum sp.]
MIDEIRNDADKSMRNAVAALEQNLKKIRTGRANPSILETVMVDYYGSATPL